MFIAEVRKKEANREKILKYLRIGICPFCFEDVLYLHDGNCIRAICMDEDCRMGKKYFTDKYPWLKSWHIT